MTKTDTITIQAVLSYWLFKDRQDQLANEKGKADIMRQVQRLHDAQREKGKHILN
jgi:hypothetical protein